MTTSSGEKGVNAIDQSERLSHPPSSTTSHHHHPNSSDPLSPFLSISPKRVYFVRLNEQIQ